MPKKAVQKSSAKKAVKKTTKTIVKKVAKKSGKLKKAPAKKIISEKEKQVKQANAIANSEKKKTTRKQLGRSGKEKRPKKNSTSEQTNTLLNAIIEGMQEKKAKNITLIDLSSLENRVSDYFIICDADSNIQVEAIADSIEEYVEKRVNEKPYHAEGFENAEWILIDYINIVAHVFQKETRGYYGLESLWADGKITIIEN